MLARVLRADPEKLQTKALRSVRARVTAIRPRLSQAISAEDFFVELQRMLFIDQDVKEYVLTDRDLIKIENISREKYSNPDWTFTVIKPFSWYNKKRYRQGTIKAFLDVHADMITRCRIQGDFLGLMPIRELEERLEGKPYRRRIIEETLLDMNLPSYIGGLTLDELLNCLFD
jgi:lipoate-protein ligase A